jgi:hypothetical protein
MLRGNRRKIKMPDTCDICYEVNPAGGTEKLFIGPPIGWQFIRFCSPCGAIATIENIETGEIITLQQLFDRNQICEGEA